MARSVYYFTDSEEFGGAEQALLTLVEHLDRGLWSPTVLYADHDALAALAQRARELGAEVRPVRPMPLGLAGARLLPAFVAELRRAKPSVFHAHLSWPLAAKYPLAAAVIARVPATVATVHLYPDYPIDRSNRIQMQLLARHVGRSVAVSQDIADRLVEGIGWPRNRIDVIRNGVSVDRHRGARDEALRAQLTAGPDCLVVLTTARLAPQKGLELLLVAASEVGGARFVIAGDGPERQRLESQARALGLDERVMFLGHRTDVPELLAASDAFALPSLYEGSSLSLLEAMAAGKPVITSAIPGTIELVVDGETGLLVRPGDVASLVEALRRVQADPRLRQRLGAAARAHVERFALASTASARVVSVYDRLLDIDGVKR